MGMEETYYNGKQKNIFSFRVQMGDGMAAVNAVFVVYSLDVEDDTPKKTGEVTSDETGAIVFENLECGSYLIQQISTPDESETDYGVMTLSVSNDGGVTLRDAMGRAVQISVQMITSDDEQEDSDMVQPETAVDSDGSMDVKREEPDRRFSIYKADKADADTSAYDGYVEETDTRSSDQKADKADTDDSAYNGYKDEEKDESCEICQDEDSEEMTFCMKKEVKRVCLVGGVLILAGAVVLFIKKRCKKRR